MPEAVVGLVQRDGQPVSAEQVRRLAERLAPWSLDPHGALLDGACGLGRAVVDPGRSGRAPTRTTPRVPGLCVAAARLDNGAALRRALGLTATTSDDGVVEAAVARWGGDAPRHLRGDWSFAAWDPVAQRLTLARDQLGVSALYWYADRERFVFAPTPAAVALGAAGTPQVDELRLARYLVSLPVLDGFATLDRRVRSLPPAHVLSVTPDRLDVRCYWHPEATPMGRPRDLRDVAGGLRSVLSSAVARRVDPPGKVATLLSGGLDSTTVASLAAARLRVTGRQLDALTSVPAHDVAHGIEFGDERRLAAAVAEGGGMRWHAVAAAGRSPVLAVREALDIVGEPVHAAANLFWILETRRAARDLGADVLLTGARGNITVSWHGDLVSQPVAAQLRHGGARHARRQLLRPLPRAAQASLLRRRVPPGWVRASALRPDVADRLGLLEQRVEQALLEARSTPTERREQLLGLGRSPFGSVQAPLAAAFGLDLRDPTADLDVIGFTLSVPDEMFLDSATGLDRMLIREATRGLLPEPVRLNRARYLQAADLIARLRAAPEDVEDAIHEIAAGPASEYVDVRHVRAVWSRVRDADDLRTWRQAGSILCRGIMGGLAVNAVATRTSR